MVVDITLSVDLNKHIYKFNQKQKLNIIKETTDNGIKEVFLEEQIKDLKCKRPIFKALPDNRKKNFAMPSEYICYNGTEADIDNSKIEYDIDLEDSVWLKLANERRKKHKEKQINDELFERAIDKLEKESYFQNSSDGTSNQFNQVDDEDAACSICNDTEDSNVNQIIFCDLCNIAVHQECYGVPYIPEGQWLCRRCQFSPSVSVKCILCPYTYGAFKQTSDNQWAHVHFANTVFNEPIEGADNALRRRSKLRCLICKQSRIGACLQCSKKLCTRAFHVTCAFFAGMHMEVKSENVGNDEGISRYVYCHVHTPAKSRPPISNASWKRLINNKIKEGRKYVLNFAREAPQISVPVIPQNKIDEIKKELNLDKIDDIFFYWTLKRQSRFGVPLIRRLQVYQNHKTIKKRLESSTIIESNDSSSTQSNTNEKNNIIKAQTSEEKIPLTNQIFHIRENFERVRLLCELVKKREKLKKEFVIITEAIFKNFMKSIMNDMSDSSAVNESDELNLMLQNLKDFVLIKNANVIKALKCSTENSEIIKSSRTKLKNAEKNEIPLLTAASPSKNNLSMPKKIKSRIDDFFFPDSKSKLNINGETSINTSSRLNKQSFSKIRSGGYDYHTEASSPSDIGGDVIVESFNSMDEDDFTDFENTESTLGTIKKRPVKRKINNVVVLKRRRRTLENDIDLSNPNKFTHNDIVWAQLDNKVLMPARVIDLRMRIHLENFPIDRALLKKPDNGDFTLIVLFDFAKTWKWIQTDRLTPCDVTTSIKNLPAAFLNHNDMTAFDRARKFWNNILNG